MMLNDVAVRAVINKGILGNSNTTCLYSQWLSLVRAFSSNFGKRPLAKIGKK